MSADITEEFPIDLSNTYIGSVQYRNTGIEFDYAFNGIGFIDFSNSEHPYRRETAQYRKDQQDNSNEPGEQTLLGWWLRSQSSFHYGAGAKFYEPAQDQNLRFKFEDSEGVNVWTAGEVTLLKKVTAVSGATGGKLRTVDSGVVIHSGNDVYRVTTSGTVYHLVDFTANIYDITDDGKYLYWIANVSSAGKLYRKPLSSTSTSTQASLGDTVELYSHPSATPPNTYMEFMKDRIFVASGNIMYYVNLDNSGTSLPVGSPDEFYKHPNTDFTFDSMAESPSDVYIAGYQGSRSMIYRVVFVEDSNGIPIPTTTQVVAEMPLGEQIASMRYYLGYMIIGTSLGVRIGAVQDNGSIVYGPLLFESGHAVTDIATYDRFAWATTGVNGKTGLVRIDLGTPLDNLVFPYANDLMVDGSTASTVGVAIINNTGRIAFTTSSALYYESATDYRSSGWLTTGRVRFNTLEDKFFKYIRERAEYNNGSIAISVNGNLITSTSASSGNQDVGITARLQSEYQQYTFTLSPNASDATSSPVLLGYQVKALPATKRQRLMQIPLRCYDFDMDRNGNQFGYEGLAFTQLETLENLEESGDIVTVQNLRTGETFQGLIEECSFTSDTTSSRISGNFGGLLVVTVRKI